MSKSETALLREELAKVVAENRDWQMRMARLEAAFSKREEIFVAEIDRLRLENAELNRRLAMYENPNAPSSTNSLYNEERASSSKSDPACRARSSTPSPCQGLMRPDLTVWLRSSAPQIPAPRRGRVLQACLMSPTFTSFHSAHIMVWELGKKSWPASRLHAPPHAPT